MMTVCRKLSLDECSLLIIGEWADWLSWCQIKALKQSIMGYQINVNQPQATWHLTTDKMEDRKSCDISSTRHLKSQQPRSCVTEEHRSRGYNGVMWRLHLSWFYKHQSLTGIMRPVPPHRARPAYSATCKRPHVSSNSEVTWLPVCHRRWPSCPQMFSKPWGDFIFGYAHKLSHSLWSTQRVIMSSIASLLTIWCFLFL